MAASLIMTSSPGPTSPLISHSPVAGYYSNRVSKRPCEASKCKRTVRSHTLRDCGQSCSSSNSISSVLERVEAEKRTISTDCHNSIPSGSMDSTTNPRRNSSTAGSYQSKKHGNPQPHSSEKTARLSRKRTKQGKSSNPAAASPTMPASPTLRKGRPPSPHPNALKKAAASESSKLSKNKSVERKTSSTADSGRGDELSSSCDSDSQSKECVKSKPNSSSLTTTQLAAPPTQLDAPPTPLDAPPTPLDAPPTQLPTHPPTKPAPAGGFSPCSDVEDDVFVDALSNLPSGDEHSTSTSEFHTPHGSPIPSVANSSAPSSAEQDPQFIKSLTNSLQEVKAERRLTGSNETCNSGGDVDITHIGLVADNEGTGMKRPKKRLNGLIQDHGPPPAAQLSIVECSVPREQLKTSGKKLGKNKRKKKTANSTTDSCNSSITSSDATKTALSSLKVPKEPPNQGNQIHDKGHKSKQLINLESSSISSASPSSSVCSQSPHTLSPSPTSSFSTVNHALISSNLNGTEVAGRKTTEDKDEWPDLGMECPPKQPEPGVHLHLEVEARSLELSSIECAEKEDSGCNLSVGSSNESCGAGGGFKHQLLEQFPAIVTTYPSASNGNCFNGNCFNGGEVLSPQFGSPHLQCQQYLWEQSQQLNKFIQQHKEQQEQQTDKHIFYPVLDSPSQHSLIQTPYMPLALSPPNDPQP